MSVYLYDIDDNHVYKELRDKLDNQKLVLFAGAGLSRQACTESGRRPPLWYDLLVGLLEWCESESLVDSGCAIDVRLSIEAGFLLDAAQELEDELEKADLHKGLREVLLCNEAKPGRAHKLITQIPFDAIITSNYDSFIEHEYWVQNGKNLPLFFEGTMANALDSYRHNKPFILKLHGSIDYPETIVLGTRSFDRLLSSSDEHEGGLKSIIAMSSILFLGYGGADPHLESLFAKVASFDGKMKRHWMLLPGRSVPPLRAKRLWKDRGINVIEYQPDKLHSGMVRFLEHLVEACQIEKPSIKGRAKLKSFESRRHVDR